jgi:pilus assembly protein TadC
MFKHKKEHFKNKKVSGPITKDKGLKAISKKSFLGFFTKSNKSSFEKDTSTKSDHKPRKNLFGLFHKKDYKQKEGVIEKYKKQAKEEEKKRISIQERKHRLGFYLERAGLGIDPKKLSKVFFNLCVIINLGISGFLIYYFSNTLGITWLTILASITTLWVLVFAVILFLIWVFFYFLVDLKIFHRKVGIEDVLPDYLQLTASNIKAGMTVDRALWYAVRTRFGVLANEIETVAKETMRGEDLKTALKKFSDKYDSQMLKRSISLLIEGIDSGGEIGTLLNKIALNIQENKIMRKEMAANVTTYVIFISFATIAAAPVLFALSGVLIKVISNLGSTLGDVGSSTSGFAISFSGTGIQYTDFRIFAITSLIISSFFSAIIIATIKKGNARYGLKYIPIFAIVTVLLFFAADLLMGNLLGSFL